MHLRTAKSSQARKQQESEFWDCQVKKASGDLPDIELGTTPWEVQEPAYRFYLQALGDLQDKRVLECGCGDGRLSVLLASV
jgi:cyclopropane fatty-acyl-phospholipid synthase-like methyltransferase